MDQVFDALGRMYGAKFASQWGQYDDGTWLAELSHLPRRCIELGIRRCREQVRDRARTGDEAWPPQPVAFAALCEPTPADLGMPSPAAAWAEASAHAHEPGSWRWSHEAVRLAGAAAGWWDMTHATSATKADRLEKRFAKHYAALVNRVMAGEQLTPRHLIEHDGAHSAAELAERASTQQAAQRAEQAGLPQRMNSDQGLRAMRAALGGA